MNNFIKIDDYTGSIHNEILLSLVREDYESIEICEDRAISEMRSYLAKRYDCDLIFSQTGCNRHELILMMALDITIYHVFCIHNPQKMSQIRKDRYERAIEWLKAVAKGDISIEGAPQLPEEQRIKHSTFLIKSNKKRVNHY